jgi:glucosyl-dolichyl phosphate glucuronosyltransferase
MRLDLLVPTLRRPHLLKRALESIGRVEPPRSLRVDVTIINNDTHPETIINNDTHPELPGLEATVASVPFPTRVLHEPHPGKSAALNTGIAASSADYIGLIDDDEELAPDWFRVVEEALASEPADFLGGRVLPLPGSEIPDWIPEGYWAVLGPADSGPVERPFDRDFPGMLKGGNAVISRAMLEKVGPYNPDLGPRIDRRLLSCEDEDMYLRLVDAGARGRYLPNLIVYHCVHPERLRKNYYRAWSFWQGASKGVLGRRHPTPFHQIAGVPRYAYGEAARGLITWLRTTLLGGPAHVRMAAELPVWNLFGRLYGGHMRSRRHSAPSISSRAGNEPMKAQ